MTLGHYLWKNTDGTIVDVDVDRLPKTSRPSNVAGPNVHWEAGTGRLMQSMVPHFYIDPKTGELFHSTNYADSTPTLHLAPRA